MRNLCSALSIAVFVGCTSTDNAKRQPGNDTTAAVATAPTDTGIKACGLLAPDDIERVTGTAMQNGEITNDYAGDSQCRFKAAKDSGIVMVTLHKHGAIEPYRHAPNSEDVTGLGDAAAWSPGVSQLAVARGDAVFSISFMSMPAKQAWAKQLARTALGKLDQQ